MDTVLQDKINDFMNEQLYQLQGLLNIKTGDIHFELDIRWDNLVEKTAEEWSKMFMEVLKWQKN